MALILGTASILTVACATKATTKTTTVADPPKKVTTRAVSRSVLDNGLTVLVIRQPDLPMVVVSALVDAGSRFDERGKEGVASLTASLLTEGTQKRSAEEIHDEIDFLGAKLSAGAGDDYASVSLTTLKKDLDAGMKLMVDVLRRPTFPAPEFARKQEEALGELEAEEQEPGAVASREFRKKLYGAGPYRHPPTGWKTAVKDLEVDDVRRFHAAAYRPDRTILVTAGDVTKKEMLAFAEELFGDWAKNETGVDMPEANPSSAPEIVKIDRDLTQANLVWGHLGTTRSDPDWYALQVMNYILGGGGFSSRLMASIRTEAGLAYSVFSYFAGNKLPGPFQIVLQTKSASTEEAITRLRSEIERIRSKPVSNDELTAAKKYLTGSFPMRFDTNSDLVSFYSQVEFFNLGLDYPARYNDLIESVTAEDVQRVARKHVRPDEALMIVVGNQKEIELSAKPK